MSYGLIDLHTRAKHILLRKGLAATQYLINEVTNNRGTFKTSVREYRLPTGAETLAAYEQAVEELRDGDWNDYIARANE